MNDLSGTTLSPQSQLARRIKNKIHLHRMKINAVTLCR